ncbi:MAG TPA: type II toxin-antitoxin system Y4mF family antitoxin [Jatrophihabitantaceae bacterium]|jgi:HTH-type transcriptional regulator/antitoxin HipB|nr:type II toxin-antitoxin system Y4mF family antitoxin [Jatrophihabitantaceae bacterium]
MVHSGETSDNQHERAAACPFGAAMRTRRRGLGLRQDELADLAGVSERFVYALENGKPSVQLDKVLSVLAALGLHLELHRGAQDGIEIVPSREAQR